MTLINKILFESHLGHQSFTIPRFTKWWTYESCTKQSTFNFALPL